MELNGTIETSLILKVQSFPEMTTPPSPGLLSYTWASKSNYCHRTITKWSHSSSCLCVPRILNDSTDVSITEFMVQFYGRDEPTSVAQPVVMHTTVANWFCELRVGVQDDVRLRGERRVVVKADCHLQASHVQHVRRGRVIGLTLEQRRLRERQHLHTR